MSKITISLGDVLLVGFVAFVIYLFAGGSL